VTAAVAERGPSLFTLGETLVLLAAPEIGPLRHANHLRVAIGGAESNVAIGASRLGAPASWAGRVGDDELGELILRTLRAEGVDVSCAKREAGVPTSLMIKERRTSATTRVSYYRADGPGARLSPADVPHDLVREAGVLHLSGITPALSASAREAVRTAAELAREAARPVSLDINYRAGLWTPAEAAGEMRALCRLSDHVFVGCDEGRVLGLGAGAREIAEAVGALGPEVVVVKSGSRGATAFVAGEAHEVPALKVTSIDPVGAGDAFVAGYLAELLAGRRIADRLRTAAACGAFAVTGWGDWESLPARADLDLLANDHGSVLR
jgi:2-dehydro-3-deoxygluconokinase